LVGSWQCYDRYCSDQERQGHRVPRRVKTDDYHAILDYTDGGYLIRHPDLKNGAGRYEMFVNNGKGIAGAPIPARIGARAIARHTPWHGEGVIRIR
jgi:hypothetical protein